MCFVLVGGDNADCYAVLFHFMIQFHDLCMGIDMSIGGFSLFFFIGFYICNMFDS